MSSQNISRRDFLRLMGIGSAALALNACFPESISSAPAAVTAIPASSSGATPDVEIALRAIEGEVQIFQGEATRVWRYQGEVMSGPEDALIAIPNTYLGPIFNVKTGQVIRVHFTNELLEPSIVHWHGLHVPSRQTGIRVW